MKYETMIWSGCSMTMGNGMIEDNPSKDFIKSDSVIWKHPKFYELFPDVKTYGEAMEAVKQTTYPMLLGKKLGLKTYNLAVGGSGIEVQLKALTSFLLNAKIDYSKTLFCYQIPELSRVEILNNLDKPKAEMDKFTFHPFNYNSIEDNPNLQYFFRNHFDFDYYTAKHLMRLVEYKGFLKSKGIDSMFFGEIEQFKYEEKTDEFMQNNMLNFNPWSHEDVKFPSWKSLIKELDIKNPQRNTQIRTLKDDGYGDDMHYSPNGHKQLAKIYERFLRERNFLPTIHRFV